MDGKDKRNSLQEKYLRCMKGQGKSTQLAHAEKDVSISKRGCCGATGPNGPNRPDLEVCERRLTVTIVSPQGMVEILMF